MTEPMTLREQLAEMRERVQHEHLAGDEEKALVATLQAILDIPEKRSFQLAQYMPEAQREIGYNSALATVAEVAGEGMRG